MLEMKSMWTNWVNICETFRQRTALASIKRYNAAEKNKTTTILESFISDRKQQVAIRNKYTQGFVLGPIFLHLICEITY